LVFFGFFFSFCMLLPFAIALTSSPSLSVIISRPAHADED
jgi:hypothetical protein